MAYVAISSTMVQAVGSFTQSAWGVAGGSGTTTTVTVPQFNVIQAIQLTGVSTTVPYVSTEPDSDNTFTATHGSGELFVWTVYGIARI